MIKYIIILAGIFLSCCEVFGCNSLYFQQILVGDTIYYSTGNIKIIRNFNSSSKDVMYCRMYAVDGKTIVAEGKYVGKERDSVWNFYGDNGHINSSDTYKLGLKNGLCKVYYVDGKVGEITEWKYGVRDGIWKQYYPNGVLKIDGMYRDNQYDGFFTFYYANSKISQTGKYSKGIRVGTWNFFDENGTEIKGNDEQ